MEDRVVSISNNSFCKILGSKILQSAFHILYLLTLVASVRAMKSLTTEKDEQRNFRVTEGLFKSFLLSKWIGMMMCWLD